MWLTDRTRYLTGLADCQMKRYLQFHAGSGYGFVRRSQSLPLATGTYVHEVLAKVLTYCKLTQGSGEKVNPDSPAFRMAVRGFIREEVNKYEALIIARGFQNADNQEEVDFIRTEQACLIEGLVWGWIRSQLMDFLDQFDLIDVEREEELVIGCSCSKPGFPSKEHDVDCQGICQMSRPDFVARRKADGTVGIHDFKTTAYLDDSYVNEYRSSVQMAVGTLGVEARIGEPVGNYYIHALVKGARKPEYDASVGSYTGPRRQSSVFCYLYHRPENSPLQEADWQPSWSWVDDAGKKHTLGRAYQKVPVWQVEFPRKPPMMTNVEYWVLNMPMGIIHNQFAFIGPYERQEVLIKEYLSEMHGEEWRWIERLWDLSNAADPVEFAQVLRHAVPRSWQCYKYHSPCPYIPVCFKQTGWDRPLETGTYIQRTPHHAPEVEEAVSRGVEIPNELEEGEEE